MNVNTYLSKKRFSDNNPISRVVDGFLPESKPRQIELPSDKKKRLVEEIKERYNFSHGGKKKTKKKKKNKK